MRFLRLDCFQKFTAQFVKKLFLDITASKKKVKVYEGKILQNVNNIELLNGVLIDVKRQFLVDKFLLAVHLNFNKRFYYFGGYMELIRNRIRIENEEK